MCQPPRATPRPCARRALLRCLCCAAPWLIPPRRRRSNNHIYAQVVDDREGKIVASASTIEKDHKKAYGGNVAAAKEVGERVAKRAVEKGVEKVHFDRNGKKYHGRIAALADAARENGLSF